MKKKLNIAILTMLLMFQTVFSPISVFADEGLPPVAPAVKSGETTGSDANIEGGDISVTSDDTADVTFTTLNECTGPQVLTGVTLKQFDMNIGGNAVTEGIYTTPLPQNQEANFNVAFDVLLDNLYCAGSYFEFDLPASLIDFNSAFNGGEQVGNIKYSYSTKGNKVKVELTKDVGPEDVSTTIPAQMTMSFAANFKLSANDIEQELELPKVGSSENAKTEFTFLPATADKEIEKTVNPAIPDIVDGNHQIEWTIWLNKAGKNFVNPTLDDNPTPTGWHTIVPDSVDIYEYDVNLTGVVDSSESKVATSEDFSKISSYFKDRHAYKIVYKTEVGLPVDQREGEQTFTNAVTFTNDGIPEDDDVQKVIKYGTALEKINVTPKGIGSNYTSKWEIHYNYNQARILKSNAVITDTLPGIHNIDISTIKVHQMDINDQGNGIGLGTVVPEGPSTYTVASVNDGFELQFNKDIDKAYKITYDAKYASDYYDKESDITITNKVTSGNKEDSKPHKISESVLEKSHLVDFDTKKITWTIRITADNPNKAINNLTLKDDFRSKDKDGTHTLVGDENDISIVGTTGSAPVKKITSSTDGFTITGINVAPGGEATVTYTTSFAIDNNGEVKSGYGNTATVEWDSYIIKEEDHYTPGTTTVNNGSKAGTFNYLDQLFTWEVKVNINKKDIENAVLTDKIGTGHEFVEDTLKVYEYTLTTGDDTQGTKATNPIDASNYTLSVAPDKKSYTLTFKSSLDTTINEKAYLVEYNTKDSDDILGIGNDELGYETPNVYKNTASFQTLGSKNYTLEAKSVTLPAHVANKLIEKRTPVQDSTKKTVTWTLDVNQSHSNLGKTELEDTPSGNLMLISDSIKVRKYDVTATSISADGTGEYVDPSIYGITVKQKADGGFKLAFPNLNEGYQVQYQTIGFGKPPESFSNDAKLTFDVKNASNQKDDSKKNENFSFSSSDSSFTMTKGNAQFKKVGVNSATGAEESLPGVQFHLYKTIEYKDYLIQTATSGTDGLFTFENINYGDYKIVEDDAPPGYNLMTDYKFTLDDKNDKKIGSTVVTKLVNVTPLPGDSCSIFTLTVKDIDGALVANKQIDLVDSNGNMKSLPTDGDGKVAIPSSFQAGEYTVKDSDGTEYEKVLVKFGKGECQGQVQPKISCPLFTVTVKDEKGDPRPNVEVTLKNTSNTPIVTETTGSNGQFTVLPSKIPAGTYKLYEGTLYLGNVKVSYQNGQCQGEVAPAPACEDFTLTVKDVDGKPRPGVTVIIKDKNDPGAQVPQPTNPTDGDGKVTIENIKPGEYEIYVNGEPAGEFTVDKDCEGTAQPAPSCPEFTLTVKDEDGILPEGTEVTITNKTTKDSFTKMVGKNGEVTFQTKTTPAGTYEVKITESGKWINDVPVTYTKTPCEAEVEKPRACDIFTITVKNPDGTPQANTKVIVTDSDGKEVTTSGSTDSKGEITLPQNQAPGTYTVYEVKDDGTQGEEINDVQVTYTKNPCAGEVQKNACPAFTLTVNDKNLAPVGENVKVKIKDQTGQVVETGTTAKTGKIVFKDKAKLIEGQSYTVFNEAGVKLGEITVSYIDGICGAAVKVPENSCPIFTLTVQDVNGNSRPNVDVTIKDGKGNTVATTKTDGKGVATVPYTVEPGVYYVYEGNVYINYITVTDICSATVKPPTGGGGGGWTPPPTEPPVNPENPTPGNPDPEKPVNPEDPTPGKPDSEKPVNLEDPTPGKPDPEKPVNLEDPTPGKPDSEKPVNPEDPTPGKPDSEKPENPTPGNPGSENPTNPGNTTTGTPGNSNGGTSVQEIIDQGKKLPPYNATTTSSQDTLDKYKDFLNNYSKLSKEDQLAVGKTVDIDKIKAAAKQMEAQLAKGKLPQTNGADQTGMIAIGLLLVAASVFFLRRRNVETK